jgi:hypothetical protein
MLELEKGLILTGAATFDLVKRKLASPEILMAVSKKYHNFAFLFETSAADKLPEHKPWDHTIPLMEGKTPPYEPVYALSEMELQALWK